METELERNKALVLRFVDEAINGQDQAVLDVICTARLAAELR